MAINICADVIVCRDRRPNNGCENYAVQACKNAMVYAVLCFLHMRLFAVAMRSVCEDALLALGIRIALVHSCFRRIRSGQHGEDAAPDYSWI